MKPTNFQVQHLFEGDLVAYGYAGKLYIAGFSHYSDKHSKVWDTKALFDNDHWCYLYQIIGIARRNRSKT